MMWGAGDGFGWWMLWGGLMMVLFWGGIVLLAIWVVQSAWGDHGALRRVTHRDASAEEIARRRYARGEITREQYTRILEDLHGPGSPAT
jgi:putative membrane protein